MKKNRLIPLGLIILSVVGCNNTSSVTSSSKDSTTSNISSTISVKEELPLDAKVFIDNVNLWNNEEITLNHKELIDGAYFMYNSLDEEMKQIEEVKEIKAKLDVAKEQYLALFDEYLKQKEAEETGYAFSELVNKYGDVNTLVREDKSQLDKLVIMYNSLNDLAKSLDVVIKAKAKLDLLIERVNELNNMSDEEYAGEQFIAMVYKLPLITELTIEDIDLVNEVKVMYDELDSSIKEKEEVKLAKELLDGLLVRVDELKVIKEHTDAFMNLVYALPSYSELKWKNSAQDAQIKACENAYDNLTEEERQVEGVIIAYKELQAIRKAFDALKEPYDITKISGSIVLGAYSNGNYTSTFTYASGKDHITVLTTYYGIPKDELSNYVTVYLNIYIEAGAMVNNPLYSFDFTEDYSGYNINVYVVKLKELRAAGNDAVQSGIGYCFSYNFVSKNDKYADSEYSGLMGCQKIHWEG